MNYNKYGNYEKLPLIKVEGQCLNGYKDIAESFNIVAAVEKTHSKILEFLAKNYSKQSFYKSKTKRLLKCSNCGHIDCLADGWKECPLCSLGTGYIQIDYNDILKNSLEC